MSHSAQRSAGGYLLRHTSIAITEPENLLFRFLDTDGDGGGTTSAIGDYSSTAATFYIQPPDQVHYYISRMLVYVRDNGAMDAEKYGNNITLTNGITVRVRSGVGGTSPTTLITLTNSKPIKLNAGWGQFCYDVDVKTWGTGHEILVARWTFAQTGRVIALDGCNGEAFEVVLNDDFSNLVDHTFMVQGWIVNT